MKKHTTKNELLNSEKDLSNYLLDSFGANLKQAIRSTVSLMVKMEMEEIRRNMAESPQFNGYYQRNLISPVGTVRNIPIARFRSGNQGLPLDTMGVFEQEKDRFYEIVAAMHASGVSQRKIDALCKMLFDKPAPPQTTKKVFAELLEQEAFQINKRSLHDVDIDILYVDGLWQSVQGMLTGQAKDQVVLACSNYSRKTGEHTFLGFSLANGEDAESWKGFFEILTKRGLDMGKTHLIVADGAGGIISALEEIAPNISLQLCLAHRYRNILKHAGMKNKKEIGKELKKLTQSTSKEEFTNRVKSMERRWQALEPRAMKSLKWKIELSLSYFSLPEEDWVHVRTTNKLERAFREVRRRTQIQDHHFQSDESARNYITAAMAGRNRSWEKMVDQKNRANALQEYLQ